MNNEAKIRRALVLMNMAIDLMEEVHCDMTEQKFVIEQIRKANGGIDVIARVK